MPALELPVQSNPGRYGADGDVRLINCYAEERGREGKIPLPLYATDGLSLFATITGGGPIRGLFVSGNALYAVSGPLVVKVDGSGSVTVLGGFPGTGTVYTAVNQATDPQILLVGDGQVAVIENNELTVLADEDLKPPNSVAFLNQRFVVSTVSGGRFQWSGLANTEFGANDFATAEFAADGLVRAFTRRGELLLFGEASIEPWFNPDGGDDVFARSGSVIEIGCLAGASVAAVEETVVFVASDKTVRVIEGYQARRISNHAVEMSIRDTSSALTAFSYAKDGHSFYVLSGADFTWVYDATTGLWHERQSYGLSRWRAEGYAEFNGRHIVGDFETGKLYQIDETVFDEAGDYLVMRVQVPISAFPKRVFLDELRIDPIPGVGLNSTDEHDADPELMLSLSRNGGKTYATERRLPMGARGKYLTQTRANRLGTSNEDGFVISLSASAAVVRGLTGLWYEGGVTAN